MGKRYHCDYCNKTMVATPSIIKTHNKGVVHQRLIHEHYQKFKDPETILAEESNKKPCIWFAKGDCMFGGICRYSHYTREEIDSFRQIVESKKRMNAIGPLPSLHDLYQKLQNEKAKSELDNNTTTLYDSNGVTHVLPWTYNTILDGYGDGLPPSLKRMKLEDFESANITGWG